MHNLLRDSERINALLTGVTLAGGFDFTFRITVDLPAGQGVPRLTARFDGPDTALLEEGNSELLRALEYLAAQTLRLAPEDYDRIAFDVVHRSAPHESAA